MRARGWIAATAAAMLLVLNGGIAAADIATGTFTIRRNYGPVGAIIDVLSGDNCAINERFSTVFATLDGQELASNLGPGVAIGLAVTVPDAPLGDYQVQATCIDPATGATNRTYVRVPFKITVVRFGFTLQTQAYCQGPRLRPLRTIHAQLTMSQNRGSSLVEDETWQNSVH